jgi:hypothetical protein
MMRHLGKLLMLAMLGGAGYVLYRQRPDLERYLRIRAM